MTLQENIYENIYEIYLSEITRTYQNECKYVFNIFVNVTK